MKTSAYLAALVASMLLSGCVVQSTYSKTVTVTKDPREGLKKTSRTW